MWNPFHRKEWWNKWESWLGILGVLVLTMLIGIKFDVFSEGGKSQFSYYPNQELRIQRGFSDVAPNTPEATAIDFLYRNEVIRGYDDGTFRPQNKVTRAEIAKMLIATNPRSNWERPQHYYANCFRDVRDEWFAPYVCQAANNGWINGYNDGTFRPNQEVTRAEALKIVILGTGVPYEPSLAYGLPYKDVDPYSWYYQFVVSGYHYGLLERFDYDQLFEPNVTLNRAQVADLIFRSILVNPGKYNFKYQINHNSPTPDIRPSFGVTLKSYPKCLETVNFNFENCTLNVRIGDYVKFAYEVSTDARNLTDIDYRLDYNKDILSCTEPLRYDLSYEALTNRYLNCEVIGDGRTDVSLTVRPVYLGGLREDFRSRKITVISE